MCWSARLLSLYFLIQFNLRMPSWPHTVTRCYQCPPCPIPDCHSRLKGHFLYLLMVELALVWSQAQSWRKGKQNCQAWIETRSDNWLHPVNGESMTVKMSCLNPGKMSGTESGCRAQGWPENWVQSVSWEPDHLRTNPPPLPPPWAPKSPSAVSMKKNSFIPLRTFSKLCKNWLF